ncbi:MAG: hypothetical protein J0L59_07280, partial [Xanthomonadales bacterium]|nr:hypothetical protein [Xanthomonadales bacterium]
MNSVGWFELYVQDMARARAFYEAVFETVLQPLVVPEDPTAGLEMLQFPGDMAAYGANGALCRMPGVPSGPGGTLVYFGCADCGATAARWAWPWSSRPELYFADGGLVDDPNKRGPFDYQAPGSTPP